MVWTCLLGLWLHLATETICNFLLKPWVSHLAGFPLGWQGVVKFSRAPWDRKKPLIFFVKKESLWHPYSDHGIATELTWCSITSLRSSRCNSLHTHSAFVALSRRSQCVHCAFTAFALPWWLVEDAVTSQNKEEGKDQEGIQSCTTADQGHRSGKVTKTQENITDVSLSQQMTKDKHK